MKKTLGWWLWFSTTAIAVTICLLIYQAIDWYPSPDGVQLACAAEHLVTTGQILTGEITHNIQLNYTPCWQNYAYPTLQYLVAGVSWFTGSGQTAVLLYSVIMFVLCVWLVQYYVTQLLQSQWYGWLAGILTILSLGLLRSVLMTPHNLTGFVCLCLSLVWLLPTTKLQLWQKYALAWCSIIPIFFLHQLSFMILGLALGISTVISCIKYKQWLVCLGIIVAAYGLAIYVTHSWAPVELLSYFTGFTANGITKPWWDHLAIWGYVMLPLAVLGLTGLKNERNKPPLLLACLVGVVIGWGDILPALGIYIVPDRVTAYLWLPIVIMSCYGLRWIGHFVSRPLLYSTMLAIVIGQGAQAYSFVNSDLVEIKNRYLPSADFVEAISWLELQAKPEQLVVGVSVITNRQIQYAGLWYHGAIVAYPWSDMNHKKITDFTTQTTLLKNVITQPDSVMYQHLHGLYTVMTQPQTSEANNYISAEHIRYVILPNHSQPEVIWKNLQPSRTIAFHNNEYTIYEVK